MREIKFRAWDKDLREWIPNESIIINNGKPIAIMHHIGLSIEKALETKGKLINPNWELMQYTGLKDKKGKEIYEGDIVKVYYGNIIAEFKRDGDGNEYSSMYMLGYDTSLEEGEIVGNIYENPELIE